MREVHVTLYQLSELPDEKSKARARDFIREQIDSNDYSQTQDDCLEVARMLGFSEVELLWSGFWTQGSGACLVGRWYACNVREHAARTEYPTDEALHTAAARIEALAKTYPHLWFKTTHRGHYYHSFSVDFEFADDLEMSNEEITEIKEALRALMAWCYKQLETQNQWLNSDENLDEEAEQREYEFTADGRHWRCGPFEHPYRPCSSEQGATQ